MARVEYTDEEIRQWFDTIDTDKDGTITIHELKNEWKGMTQAEVKEFFSDMDKDGNKSVSFEEFKRSCQTVQQRSMDDFIKQHFAEVDTDGNGTISKDEVQILIELTQHMYQIRNPDEAWACVLDEVDVNKDGRLTIEEFTKMMKKCLS